MRYWWTQTKDLEAAEAILLSDKKPRRQERRYLHAHQRSVLSA